MRRLFCVIAAVLLLALPAAAQTAAPVIPAPAIPGITQPATPVGSIAAGHAVALGIGMFAGAMLGSTMIGSGGLGAAVGALTGLSLGHWYWATHRDQLQ
jgi:hypothetical protein